MTKYSVRLWDLSPLSIDGAHIYEFEKYLNVLEKYNFVKNAIIILSV